MRILAVGAHPDDLEFLCAGSLAKNSPRLSRKRTEEVYEFASTSCGIAGSTGSFNSFLRRETGRKI